MRENQIIEFAFFLVKQQYIKWDIPDHNLMLING